MTWAEVDLDNGVWTIPAQRMKAAKEHRVPLILTAIAQLGERGSDTDLDFGSETKADKPISDMSMTALLRRMEYENITRMGLGRPSATGRAKRPISRAKSSKRRWRMGLKIRPKRPMRDLIFSIKAAS